MFMVLVRKNFTATVKLYPTAGFHGWNSWHTFSPKLYKTRKYSLSLSVFEILIDIHIRERKHCPSAIINQSRFYNLCMWVCMRVWVYACMQAYVCSNPNHEAKIRWSYPLSLDAKNQHDSKAFKNPLRAFSHNETAISTETKQTEIRPMSNWFTSYGFG